MLFMNHFEEIMKGFKCDFNTAVKMYQRGTHWEDQNTKYSKVELNREFKEYESNDESNDGPNVDAKTAPTDG